MKYATVILKANEEKEIKARYSIKIPWQSPLTRGFSHKNTKYAITVYDRLHPALCRGAIYMRGSDVGQEESDVWMPIKHEIRSLEEYIVEAVMSIQLWDEAFDFKLHKDGRDSEREKEEKEFIVAINGMEWKMKTKKEIRAFCDFLDK